MKIPLTALDLDRRQHRLTLDPAELRSLAEDMARPHGQLQPIVVRRKPNGRWALIAGRRRTEAARLLGWLDIEANEIEATEGDNIPALAENLKRKQLSPLEEAFQVIALHTDDNMPIAEIAERTGHGTSWVQDRLALADLDDELQQAIHGRHLSIGAALQLSSITDVPYRNYLVHIAKTNGATIHQAQAWCQEWKARQQFAAADGLNGAIPQLPPPAPLPLQGCWFCREPIEAGLVLVLKACPDCHKQLTATIHAEPASDAPARP